MRLNPKGLTPMNPARLRALPVWAALTLAPLPLIPAAVRAQPSPPTSQAAPPADGTPDEESPTARGRAANVARMAAERLNGGLGVYRTAACMHLRGGGSCLIQRDASGYLFRFLGGPPGWQQLGLPATHESEILIAPDGSRVVQVVYNGPPR